MIEINIMAMVYDALKKLEPKTWLKSKYVFLNPENGAISLFFKRGILAG